ncbi:MAG: methionyl-tRNA formyltransferase [Actinobacteria bacterium]|nr:methionyl-tRNA formyltransferase [Actinomycetota bacterium]
MIVAVAATADVAIPTLDWLLTSKHQLLRVVTTPDSKAGRGKVITPSPVAMWAEANGLEILKPDTSEEMISAFQGVEIVLAIAYGRILSNEILKVPRHGFLNLHFSLLPAYRGAAPVQRSILHGDVTTGISIFQIDENLDTGPIYVQKEFRIPENSTSDEVLRDLSNLGASSFDAVLEMINQGVAPTAQSTTGVSFAPKITKEEAKIDWHLPAKKITDAIRAFTPNPGAWTSHRGLSLKITDAREEVTEESFEPGTLHVEGKKIFVGTATNSVEMMRVIPAGKKEMKASEWINGARLSEGEIFE